MKNKAEVSFRVKKTFSLGVAFEPLVPGSHFFETAKTEVFPRGEYEAGGLYPKEEGPYYPSLWLKGVSGKAAEREFLGLDLEELRVLEKAGDIEFIVPPREGG